MKTITRTFSIVGLLLGVWFASPASAQTILQPDAAPPGAGVVVSLIAANGGFTGTETITTSCPEILVGPKWLSNGAGNPAAPISNAVLSTVFFILENAPTKNCFVSVNGTALAAAGAIDNVFSIVQPLPNPIDGGVGDLDGVVNNVITIPSSARSDGGVVVFSQLSVPVGKTLVFDTTDPVPATGGNEAFMPIIVLVRGDATIDGVVDASGGRGRDYGDNKLARSFSAQSTIDGGDGGHGGPGGGGGAAGGPHNATASGTGGFSGTGGDGFSGGSGSPSIVYAQAPGGRGVAYPPVGVTGGNSPFDRGGGFPTSSVTNGGGGGSGNPFGTGAYGAQDQNNGGAAGYGGGGGAATANGTRSGGGGGGFATVGLPGGVGGTNTNAGRGGFVNGLASMLPLFGGSGGGGGDGWITGTGPNFGNFGGGGGGGGGGAFMFHVVGTLSGSGVLKADGGNGGAAGPGNCAASGGGGGSGGGILLAARTLAFTGTVSVRGGVGGANANAGCSGSYNQGGHGGEGRVRFDGAPPPTLTAGPTATVGSTWEGCAVTGVSGSVVQVSAANGINCNWVAMNGAGAVVASGTTAEGNLDLSAQSGLHGVLTVIVSRDGVPSPAGIGRIVVDSDGDGIPDFADGDDDNDGISDIDELGGVDLSGDSDADGVPDYMDPGFVICSDANTDGECDSLPLAVDPDGDGVPSHFDKDSDGDGIPDSVEGPGAAFDANLDGRIDDLTDNDFDGVAGVVDDDDEDNQSTGTTGGLRDTDGDGIPDSQDLDSDGDGLFDVVEAGGGGLDLDGDGRVDDTTDADGDGLPDVVDPQSGGAINGTPFQVPDSDGDGTPDFLEQGAPIYGSVRLSNGELRSFRCYYDAVGGVVSCETNPSGELVLYPPICGG